MQSISVTWYSEICWFLVKKCRCQQNLKSVSRDSYIFSIFFRKGITVTSFIIAGHVWQISGRGSLFALPRPPHPWEAPKKSILNRVKECFFYVSFLDYFRKTPNPRCFTGVEYVSAPRGQKKKISFISPVIWRSKYLSKRSCYWKQWFQFKGKFSLKLSLETLIIIFCDFTVYTSIKDYPFQKIILYV